MIEVEHWAELRREHFVRGTSIRELAKRTGVSRNTGAGRCARRSRRALAARLGPPSSIRSGRRSSASCARSPGSPRFVCAS